MSTLFPRLQKHGTTELLQAFSGKKTPKMSDDDLQLWLEEAAIDIAKAGARAVTSLLALVPHADELRLRAILLAMGVTKNRLSPNKRARVCAIARSLLTDNRAMVVAEAIDTLSNLECRQAAKAVMQLLDHPSPFVVGSVLRFFARLSQEKAVPLLEKALKSKEPIVRQNAIDELDEMHYKPALAKIKPLVKDPDKDVRQAARTAVANLCGRA